ncbi:MAG: hypothetical protein H8E09_00930 [Gammaproteobacteria bacterium]|nr:hypothetical protein [Gammaproteobacteria bacterium]
MVSNQIVNELRNALENTIIDVASFYDLVDQMFVNEEYGNQDFIQEQVERYYHEAGVYWPTGFALITSALVNSSSERAKVSGRKLLDELYDQCRESLEALNELFFEIELDTRMENNPDMRVFFRRVLESVELSEDEYKKYDQILGDVSGSENTNNYKKIRSHINTAKIQLSLKEYDAAKMSMLEAIKFNPMSPRLWAMAGVAAKTNGDLTEAKQYFLKAVELDPLFENGFGNLGLINSKLHNYEESAKGYKKALEINPHSYVAARSLAKLYFSQGDYTSCMNYIRLFDEIIDEPGFLSGYSKQKIEDIKAEHQKYRADFKSPQEN